ncbi:MAG: phosphoribosylformylglycinamidine synthase I [Chloroflexota bacterium]
MTVAERAPLGASVGVASLRSKPSALVVRAPGTNCDRETALALERAGAHADRVHVEALLGAPRQIQRYSMLILPGGFSYGDHLGAGSLFAHRLAELRSELVTFADSGRPILGICNGFQALLKLGLLSGGALVQNASGRFECRWVWVRNSTSVDHPFLGGSDLLAMPVAHGEGRFVADPDLDTTADRRVALVYCNADGRPTEYPGNPNGSDGGVAGLTSPSGHIFGLMPHPERAHQAAQIPQGRPLSGLAIFQSMVAYARR